ncbi:MAG: DNA recombination protein RmuC [Bacillota bacterium]|nr:MAG: DNA recombination protein RmuC [Bacillota bacterium]
MDGQFSWGVLLLAVLGGGVVIGGILALVLRRPGMDPRLGADVAHLAGDVREAMVVFGQVRQGVESLHQAQAELRGHVVDLYRRVDQTTMALADKTSQVQTAIHKEIEEAQNLVKEVRTQLAERKQRDDEVERAVRHLEAVLAGAPSKGAAGENILDAAFSGFPPDMVERNFRVRGKVVEYALVLSGNRRMPIDSKWPATAEVEKLADEPDPAVRQRLVTEVRAAIRRKVSEVAQYIDPMTTTDMAIAAIPDAVYPLCGELAFEAYRRGVVLMSYSMTVPYVLNLYNLHLKYARSVDLDSLDHALSDVERSVESLDKVLDNSIQRGATMIGNAYDEIKRIADQIRRSLILVRSLPAVAEREALPEGEGEGLFVGEGPEADPGKQRTAAAEAAATQDRDSE